jgi:hypothetical protein
MRNTLGAPRGTLLRRDALEVNTAVIVRAADSDIPRSQDSRESELASRF